jgi:DNA polymerase
MARASLAAADPGERPVLALASARKGVVDLDSVRKAAAGCRACDLWARATQTVFGSGPVPARLMLVGEQPGNDEDLE